MRVDRSSRLVLEALQAGADPDVEALARRTGLAFAVVEDRYARLRAQGVDRPSVRLDPEARGCAHSVLVYGVPGVRTTDEVLRRLAGHEGVEDVMTLAARSAVTFRVEGPDVASTTERAAHLAREAGFETWSTVLVVRRVPAGPRPVACQGSG